MAGGIGWSCGWTQIASANDLNYRRDVLSVVRLATDDILSERVLVGLVGRIDSIQLRER